MADKKYRMRLSLSDGLFWFLDFISPQGPKGEKGDDGVSPVVAVEEIEGGHKVTVTDASGARAFIVLDGDDGVGVVAIEQTSTSDEDGGSNEITATLSDGTKSTFTVKNGRKGSQGDAGNGIKAAALNSDYTLTLTFDDGTIYTTPSIRGAKGETGAPGVHIGNEAPTNGEKVWIDPTEEAEEGIQMDVVAKVGQLLAVAEVDENGKPTKLVAVDLPQAETPNFAANEGEKGYIEGRTHYVDEKGVIHKLPNMFIDAEWMATSQEHIDPNVFIAEQKLTSGMWQKRQQDIQPGLVYDVHINDVVYPCEAFTEDGGVCIGNNTSLNKNNIPFCIYWAGGSATAGFFYKKSTLAYPIYMKVTGHSWTEYNKLPEEFLPDGVVKSVNGNKPDEKGNVTVEIPESTGGGVDVTASVGQTIVVKEVDADGKPTKWEAVEHQEKICGVEDAYFVQDATAEFVYAEDGGVVFYVATIPFTGTFEEGNTYTVLIDGVKYETSYNADVNAIGNMGLFGYEDTGEPFIIGDNKDGTAMILYTAEITQATISILGSKINTIDPKYMPTPYGARMVFDIEELVTELTDSSVENISTTEQEVPNMTMGKFYILYSLAETKAVPIYGQNSLHGQSSVSKNDDNVQCAFNYSRVTGAGIYEYTVIFKLYNETNKVTAVRSAARQIAAFVYG